MTFTARLRVDAEQGLSRAMIAAARSEFRRIATETGESAIDNILEFAKASHGDNPRPGQRSTTIHDRSNYAFLVTTIPRGVNLEMFVANSDNNFLVKFHALNGGRKGRAPQRAVKPRVIAFPPNGGSGYRISREGNVVVQSIAGDSGAAGSGFYRDAIRLALVEHNLT